MNGSLATVAWLTWRQLFARRRVWLAIAIVAVPYLFTFFYRFVSEDREGDRLVFMLGMNGGVVLGVLVPLTAVIFATTAFGGEVEDGTLIYLLVRPVKRWQVVAIKFVVAATVSSVISSAAVFFAWYALSSPELPVAFARGFVVSVVMASFLYSAVFCYLGLLTRRGVVIGLIYLIVFENLLARNLAGVKWLSVREFASAVAQWAGGTVIKWQQPGVPMKTVWIVGPIILVAALLAAMRKFSRYEMAERI